jgi:two-component system response regulator HydG
VVLARTEYLTDEDLPIVKQAIAPGPEVKPAFYPLDGETTLEQMEKATVLKTLQADNGNKSEAARRLGITRKTLHKKLKKYGVMP